MRTILFEFSDLRIFEEDGRYYALYDAGAHQVVMRKDELTKAEADQAIRSRDDAMRVLFRLQERLIQSGNDPYVPNTSEL